MLMQLGLQERQQGLHDGLGGGIALLRLQSHHSRQNHVQLYRNIWSVDPH